MATLCGSIWLVGFLPGLTSKNTFSVPRRSVWTDADQQLS
jgi:hypothetical protein